MSNFIYDYYTVRIPTDAGDDEEYLGGLAIAEAEERSRLYAMPCVWEARKVGEEGDDTVFQVRRKRHRSGSTCRQ